LAVGEVRRIGKRHGVGWIKVKKVWGLQGLGAYLEKYMHKDFSGQKLSPGIRRWSTIGGFDGCKVNSIVRDSPATNAMRLYRSVCGIDRVPYRDMTRICRSDNIHDPEHLAACILHARDNGGDTIAFTWSWSRLEIEYDLQEGHPLDGRLPY